VSFSVDLWQHNAIEKVSRSLPVSDARKPHQECSPPDFLLCLQSVMMDEFKQSFSNSN
jgi:hypothetical protein